MSANANPDSEKERRTRRLIESLEAFQLLCKQLDFHAGELLQTYRDEIEPKNEN